MPSSNLVYFNSRDEMLRVEMSKIVYFEASGNITELATTNKLKGLVSMNLGNMERFLAEQAGNMQETFVRIGKRYIVNINYIYRINIPTQKLILSDFEHFVYQLDISKDALKRLREVMIKYKK